MAKALLVRPNMAALRIWGSYAVTYLQGIKIRQNHHLNPLIISSNKLVSRVGLVAAPTISRRRHFSIRATMEGNIDSPLMQSMEKKIKESLSAESVTVKDAYGDGRHVSIDVISASFEGQSAVNRQRMVYKAIWEELQNTVHAVDQMTTKTPAEAGGDKQ